MILSKSILYKNILIAGVIFFNLIIIEGCIYTPRIYKYAKIPFSLTEYLKSGETELDTATFYYNEWVDYRNIKIVDVMKFYSDGRFEFNTFEGRAYTKKLGDSLDNDFEYYKIEKRILKLEVYQDRLTGFAYWQGNIHADSIVFFKIGGHKAHLVYKKER